jgi:DNA polymerase I-like protein with 3'-5' exonuclease and polymerase domains
MELKFDPENPVYTLVNTPDLVNEALDELEKNKVIAVDIEGTGLDPYTAVLLTVQISTPEKCFIFDARALPLRELPRLKEFLESNSAIKLTHNGKFDYKHLQVHTGIKVANLYDTMLAEVILNAGIGRAFYSLKDLAFQYVNLKLKKEVRESFENMTANARLTDEQMKYGAMDTLVLFPIFEKQLERLQKENLVNIAKLEFATTRAVGDMELNGIYINEEKWRGIIDNLRVKRNELATQFQDSIRQYYKINMMDLFGNMADVININSQQQLMDLFNSKLHLNLPSTGDGLLANVQHPVVKLLRQYRGYEKLISAFGDSLLAKINPVTHRIHPEFNQLGAATGRFSCNNPNLQQIPRNSEEAPFRECFNPKPGYKLVTADYSSMEMRILADLSGDEKMVNALNQGLDIHSYTAALMFNLPYTDNFKKEHKDLRQIAKPIGFGLMYGMGAVGLAGRIGQEMGKEISKEEGADYMNRYFASYPSVQKFLEHTAKSAVQKGYSVTVAGRKRWYHKPEKDDPDFRKKISSIEREAKNHPIQGANADAVKYALVFLQERLKNEKIDGNLILTVHDEIVSEVREDQAEYWAKVQSDEMIRAAALFIKKVKIVSDPFVADVWEH